MDNVNCDGGYDTMDSGNDDEDCGGGIVETLQ
jgi:hypothetical protein